MSDELELSRAVQDWDYAASVAAVRPMVIRWRTVTVELLHELHVARVALSSQGARTDLKGRGLTWEGYCKDIGMVKHTANRWLQRYDDETRTVRELPDEKPDGKNRPEEPSGDVAEANKGSGQQGMASTNRKAPAGLVLIDRAAEITGLAPWTLRDHVRRGKIPCYRPFGPRGRIVFDPSELKAHIRATAAGVPDLRDREACRNCSLANLLIRKGIITEAEYLAETAGRESVPG